MAKHSIKNIKKVTENEIVLELNHPVYGWIPYTAIPNSGEEEMQEIWEQANPLAKEYDVDILTGRAITEVLINNSKKVSELKGKYSADERALWQDKKKEAEIVLQGGSSELLSIEAEIKEIPVKELAAKILSKNKEYQIAVVRSESLKKKIEKDFENVKTIKDLNRIVKSYKSE